MLLLELLLLMLLLELLLEMTVKACCHIVLNHAFEQYDVATKKTLYMC